MNGTATRSGTKRVVSYLTQALVGLGHDVTLFASGDSQTGAPHLVSLEKVRRMAHTLFDVLHFHLRYLPLPTFSQLDVPFVGRICAEKRVDLAIEIAACAGLQLKIAAKVNNADAAYFRDVIQSLLSRPGVEFIGEIDDARKAGFLSGARVLLFRSTGPSRLAW